MGFKITRRHYDIIINQGHTNWPQECGGFLGGKDMIISAILPAFNQHLYNKTDTFAITSEDIERAHAFFEKHGLQYYGVYHTHPKASAQPSDQDLKNIQRFMFIISYLDYNNPDFAAYEVKGRNYNRLPLEILAKEAAVVDIHGTGKINPVPGKSPNLRVPQIPVRDPFAAPKTKAGDMLQEMGRINDMFNEYITEEKIKYHKLRKPGRDQDGFSTLA